VTFICENCDTTLKKKQLKNHQYSCGTNAFICIDCKKRFLGNDHEGHTSCLTEQEMTWGQYYKGKKPNNPNGQNGNAQNGNKQNNNNPNNQKNTQDNSAQNGKIHEETKNGDQAEEKVTFNGWKNTIKALLKRETGAMMKKSALKKKLKEILINENYEIDEEEFNQSLDKVLEFKAFQIEDGCVKYLPPGQRVAKSLKSDAKFKEFNWGKKIVAMLKADPNHKLKLKRLEKSIVEEFLSQYPQESEETASELYEKALPNIPNIVMDSKFIQLSDD
jgi:hypothetical protein